MNYDGRKNQETTRSFVDREVYTCVTQMVEYILRQEGNDKPFDYDDLENLYTDNQEKIEKLREEIGELESEFDELEDSEKITKIKTKIDDLEMEIEELESEQDEPHEVYEFWIVSEWLCNKLKELGEVVISSENIWGRCCTGQSIALDYVIYKICEDIEILEGQKHEYK